MNMMEKLAVLGFTQPEVNIAMTIARNENGTIPSVAKVQRYFNLDNKQAERVRYLYTIIIGKVIINIDNIKTMEDLKGIAHHFRKINGSNLRQISISDLKSSNIAEVPRLAIVLGIEDNVYGVLNSKSSKDKHRYFSVIRIGQTNIEVRTTKQLVLKYRNDKRYELEGVVRVLGKDTKGRTLLSINKDYCRLCNRYVIVASLRMPREHLGAVALISKGGDIIYVYAKTIYGNRTMAKTPTERVYDFGILGGEIKPRIMRVAKEAFRKFSCAYSKYFPPVEDYSMMPRKLDSSDEDIVI